MLINKKIMFDSSSNVDPSQIGVVCLQSLQTEERTTVTSTHTGGGDVTRLGLISTYLVLLWIWNGQNDSNKLTIQLRRICNFKIIRHQRCR